MRTMLSTAVACTFFCLSTGIAQQPAASASESAAAETSKPEPITSESEDRELTRAERRASRRSEREADEAAAVAATGDSAAEDDEGIICRRESILGSHRRVRICTTRAQREAARESARETLRDVARPRGDLGPEGN